jgi:hypothetical protein
LNTLASSRRCSCWTERAHDVVRAAARHTARECTAQNSV